MLQPGPLNLITDVEGIRVGNAEDTRARTGVTVVLPDLPSLSAVDVRGGAPGTRETDALDPTCLVDRAARALMRGVYEAETVGDLASYRELFGVR